MIILCSLTEDRKLIANGDAFSHLHLVKKFDWYGSSVNIEAIGCCRRDDIAQKRVRKKVSDIVSENLTKFLRNINDHLLVALKHSLQEF